nr:MAG TPA: hypothetical protein [Inoviridae sp.]
MVDMLENQETDKKPVLFLRMMSMRIRLILF